MLVVTVCTANLCRSPFAERLLQDALDAEGVDATVRSTGVAVIAGMSPPPAWVDIALQFGVDLSDHRAVAPGPWLDEADLVLAMTADHLREIVVVHPFLLGRATTLAGAANSSVAGADLVQQRTGKEVLATPRRDDIDDPVGRAARIQREVARRLAQTCSALARTWPVAR